MSIGFESKDQEALKVIEAAIESGEWRIESVLTFRYGVGAQVYIRKPNTKAAWMKAGPLLLPTEEQTVGDLLTMLGSMVPSKEGN